MPRLVSVASELRIRSGQSLPSISTAKIMRTCFPHVHVTGRVLPAGIHEAVSRTSSGDVLIYARGLSSAEKRFAIAHGMAHLLFDGEESACLPGRSGVASVEDRADRFAEELLVPLHELAKYARLTPSNDPDRQEFFLDHVDEISSRFHVPSAVMERRMRKLYSLARIA